MLEWSFEPTLLNGTVNWVAGWGVNCGFHLGVFHKDPSHWPENLQQLGQYYWPDNSGYSGDNL